MATIAGNFDTPAAYWNYVTLTLTRHEKIAPWHDQYRLLKAYYYNNGLYDVLRAGLSDLAIEPTTTKSLRNPAFRVVEFYASKLWPGSLPRSLPIETKNRKLIPAIEQLWIWSNWSTEKQTFARWFPMLGDAFIKVAAIVREDAQKPNRVFMQNIDPEYVTDFTADERGYLLDIRLDIPITVVNNGKTEYRTRTEFWNKEEWRIYEHQEALGAEEAKLGNRIAGGSLLQFGIDFVPFVWQPFRAVGDERGVSAYIGQLDKIDEANRQATRLSAMLFRHNRAIWALQANALDATGRPLPPPKLPSTEDGVLEIEDDAIISLPGNGSLTSLVPNINYADALAVLKDQMAELEDDMPELAYYRLRDAGATSGRAVRIQLDDAHDRALEARGGAETALIRAHQMALSIGQNLGLFTDLGTYEAGDFVHEFRERAVFPVDEFEDAQTTQTYTSAGVPLESALLKAGWTEDDIIAMRKVKAAEAKEQADMAKTALDEARRRFNQENNPGDDEDDEEATAQPLTGDEGLQLGIR